MKFACDRCQTRYSISDEKVQGKVLKIRCKTCGNIIVLREQGAESQAAAPAAAQGAAAAGARGPAPRTEVEFKSVNPAPQGAPRSRGDVDWFVAVKGTQHGPMKRDDVVRMLREGRVHDRSYCWNEELPGWTRLRDLPDFADAVAQGAVGLPPPPPPDEEGGGQVVSLEAHRASRAGGAPAPAAAAAPAAHDPFAAVTAGVPGASGQLETSAPRESTRVFIMNAGLHNRAKKHKTYAVVAVACAVGLVTLGYLDYAGYVQIPLLNSVVNYTLEATGAEAPKKRQLLAKFTDTEMDPELECKLLGNCKRFEEQKASRARKAANPSGGGVGDLDLEGAFGNVGAGDGSVGQVGPDGKPLDPTSSNAAAAADIRAQLGSGGGLKPMVGPSMKKVDVNDTIAIAGNQNVDMTQVMKVVKQNIGSVKPCVESAAKNGVPIPPKGKLLVLIRGNGTVGAAKFMDPIVAASSLGECLAKAAKKWKFAPTGTEYEVEVPLILQTSM